MKHRVYEISGMIICLAVIVAVTIFGENPVLFLFVNAGTNMTVDVWITDVFYFWAFLGIGCASIMIIIWYLWGSLFASSPKFEYLKKRIFWGILFALLLVVAFVCCIATNAQEYVNLAYIAYIMNTLFYFYITTALFSPVRIKYIVPGSKWLRKSW